MQAVTINVAVWKADNADDIKGLVGGSLFLSPEGKLCYKFFGGPVPEIVLPSTPKEDKE